MRLHPLRKLIILATLLITASMLLAIPVASAQGPARDFGSEAGFLSSLNSQRAAGGLGPLALNGSMTAAADSWALSMATGSFLAHAGDIISGTPSGWTKVGENVGRGQSVTSLTSAFMNSQGHRANIMDASYTHIGIAVYTNPRDGRIYTTHRFAALPGAAPVAAAPVVAAPVAAAPTAVPTIAPAPTAIPAPPTAVPVQPTPVPATPVPTAAPIPSVVSTPEPEPTPIPATATPEPTAVPATPEPVLPTATSDQTELDADGFGAPPEQLAFVDSASINEAATAKLASKTAKFGR